MSCWTVCSGTFFCQIILFPFLLIYPKLWHVSTCLQWVNGSPIKHILQLYHANTQANKCKCTKSTSSLYTHIDTHIQCDQAVNTHSHLFLSHPICGSYSSEASELQHICCQYVSLCADSAEYHCISRELCLGLATLACTAQRRKQCQKAHSTFTKRK